MYDDIQNFEKNDFIEGQWRSFIAFLQYTAPFYITYHFFRKIFHGIEALAKLFIDAEVDDVKELVDGVIAKFTSDPPHCPFIPQILVAVRIMMEAKGGVYLDRYTPRQQLEPQAEVGTSAPPEMPNLMDEPIPVINFHSVMKLGSGSRMTPHASNAPVEFNKSLLRGDAESFIPATMKQSSAAVGLTGSRWAASEEVDDSGWGQSPFALTAREGPEYNTSESEYTGNTAIEDDEVKAKDQAEW
ncbi:hypothetical protein MMC18_002506 [Xylographa bjoerkii]|nr:hypothetical protein [Xylographa bjoerkii]